MSVVRRGGWWKWDQIAALIEEARAQDSAEIYALRLACAAKDRELSALRSS